ncbi:MAG: DUF2786 domain-containing protein [Emergencia sp.]|nr:DUF2786 domain-containing protein [Emergencia sp.]
MNNDLEKIKQKIRKLLAMADRGSEYEAKVAMAKAQRLMMEYKLQLSDFQEKPVEIIHKQTDLYYTAYRNTYRQNLVDELASLYCCANYINTSKGSMKHYITLSGWEADVEVLENVLVFADVCISDWFRDFKREEGWKYSNQYLNALKNEYGRGFASGIRHLLERQMQEVQQEWGLVPVVPQEAKAYVEALAALKDEKWNYSHDDAVYMAGVYDGKNAEIQDKVTGLHKEENT